MRLAKPLVFLVLAAALAWSEASAAGLEDVSADGWHGWQVDAADGYETQFYVLIEDGKPARIHSWSSKCREPTKESATDHGAISPAESYAWFRAVVEDAGIEKRVRDAALFGLVESGSDDAFEYIDQILSLH